MSRLEELLKLREELRSYADKQDLKLLPSKADPKVKRWQRPQQPVTDIPTSKRKWGAGETANGTRFKDFFSNITNNQGFGQHIDTSIPGYAEHRGRMAWAVAHTFPHPHVVDIGASEGQWGHTIHAINPQSHIVDVDPNPDMIKNNVNPHSEKVMAAWGKGFHDGERDIPAFETGEKKADVIGSHMVRQFVTRDGDEWYGEVKKHLSPKGVFLYSCKVTPSEGKEDDWKRREAEKDEYKRQTYTQEELDKKADEVLVGMHHLMMPHEEEMEALGRHFKHVRPLWHSANFRGYVAGDNHATVSKIEKHYHDRR